MPNQVFPFYRMQDSDGESNKSDRVHTAGRAFLVVACVLACATLVICCCFIVDHNSSEKTRESDTKTTKRPELRLQPDFNLVNQNENVWTVDWVASRMTQQDIDKLCSRQRYREHSYVTAIILNDENHKAQPIFLCTGTLVSDKWVLTISQCLYGRDTNTIRVRAGSDVWSRDGTLHKLITTIEFKSGSTRPTRADIVTDELDVLVALKITPAVKLGTTANAARLPGVCNPVVGGQRSRDKVWIVGWLNRRVDQNERPLPLLPDVGITKHQLTISTTSSCDRIWPAYSDKPGYYCARADQSRICDGTDGFPMVTSDHLLLGIHGQSCHYERNIQTHLFINISTVNTWIQDMSEGKRIILPSDDEPSQSDEVSEPSDDDQIDDDDDEEELAESDIERIGKELFQIGRPHIGRQQQFKIGEMPMDIENMYPAKSAQTTEAVLKYIHPTKPEEITEKEPELDDAYSTTSKEIFESEKNLNESSPTEATEKALEEASLGYTHTNDVPNITHAIATDHTLEDLNTEIIEKGETSTKPSETTFRAMKLEVEDNEFSIKEKQLDSDEYNESSKEEYQDGSGNDSSYEDDDYQINNERLINGFAWTYKRQVLNVCTRNTKSSETISYLPKPLRNTVVSLLERLIPDNDCLYQPVCVGILLTPRYFVVGTACIIGDTRTNVDITGYRSLGIEEENERTSEDFIAVSGGKNHWLRGGQRRSISKIITLDVKRNYTSDETGLSLLRVSRDFAIPNDTLMATFPVESEQYTNEDWIGSALLWNTTLHLVNEITPMECPSGTIPEHYCAGSLQASLTWCSLNPGTPLISLAIDDHTDTDQPVLVFRGILVDKPRHRVYCEPLMAFLDTRIYKNEIEKVILVDENS